MHELGCARAGHRQGQGKGKGRAGARVWYGMVWSALPLPVPSARATEFVHN